MPFLGRTIFISAMIHHSAWADTVVPIDNTRPEERFSQRLPQQPILSQKLKPTEPASTTTSKQISLTVEQLAERPDLVLRALIPVLKNNDMRGAEILLPI
ncbi:hypothetical protein KCU_11678, partial [Pasteurella multocida subsp. multocida str. P52VAC]